MKNLGMIAGVVAILALSACDPKGRSDQPTPKPTPNSTVLVVREISGGELIIENNLVSWEDTQDKAIVDMYATLKDDEKVTTFQVERGLTKWLFRGKTDLAKLGNAEKIVAYLSASETGNNQFQVTSSDYTFTTGAKASELGNFTVSHHYTDVLIGEASPSQGNLKMELRSPFRQVRLILKNSPWEQAVSNISVRIEGTLYEAHYSNGTWSGTPTPLVINYKDKETTWAGHEADTLMLAFPAQKTQISATITYTTASGSKTETITTEELELSFTFAPQEIENPSELVFTPMADTDYWVKANQDAFNLITSNYGGALTEAECLKREYPHTWARIRPLVDEVMHSKQLYKDDFNAVCWELEMVSNWKSEEEADWGFAFGLETLDGTLVEIYPPLYQYNSGGGQVRNVMTEYVYTSVSPGKYRLVLFVNYPEWYLPESAGKWFKLPMLDALSGWETLTGGSTAWKKRYLEPVPMEKSSYKDMDIIEVIDRKKENNLAPRWTMGYLYKNWEDYDGHQPLNTETNYPEWYRQLIQGSILAINTLNTSNQHIRGTIVAKAEYLPMHHPDGYARLQETGNNKGMNLTSKGWKTYISAWSHEVGRTEISIHPNSKQKVGIEIKNLNDRWYDDGWRDIERLGPAIFIHFYWVDESGNEHMMMRADYEQLRKLKNMNWAFSEKPRFRDYHSQFSQNWKVNPERLEPSGANGFEIF